MGVRVVPHVESHISLGMLVTVHDVVVPQFGQFGLIGGTVSTKERHRPQSELVLRMQQQARLRTCLRRSVSMKMPVISMIWGCGDRACVPSQTMAIQSNGW